MSYPTELKKKACILRKEGYSIIKIARELDIAKSTSSLWVKDVKLPDNIQKYLSDNSKDGRDRGRQIMRAMREKRKNEMSIEAQKLIRKFNNVCDQDLWKLWTALLFWCEGSKRHLSSVGFINSDPSMMKVFLRAMRCAFKLDEKKFRITLHLHSYHNEKKQISYWSEVTNIPTSQFTRSYIKPNTEKRRREGYPGCVSLRYFNSQIARELDVVYHTFANKYGGLVKGL